MPRLQYATIPVDRCSVRACHRRDRPAFSGDNLHTVNWYSYLYTELSRRFISQKSIKNQSFVCSGPSVPSIPSWIRLAKEPWTRSSTPLANGTPLNTRASFTEDSSQPCAWVNLMKGYRHCRSDYNKMPKRYYFDSLAGQSLGKRALPIEELW